MPSNLFFAGLGLVVYAGAMPLSFTSSDSTMAVPTRVEVVHTEITQLSLIVPRTTEVTSTPTFKTQEAAIHTEYTAASLYVPNKAVKTQGLFVHTEYIADSLEVPKRTVKTQEAAVHTEYTATSLDVPIKAAMTAHTELTAGSLLIPRATITPAPVSPRQLDSDEEVASGNIDEDGEYASQLTTPAPEAVSPLPKHGWFHLGRIW